MTDRELMQQALDALDSDNPDIQLRAAKALRARLDGWERVNMNDHKEGDLGIGTVKWDASAPLVVHPHPAFQATQPQRECADSVHDRREWQGLTDEEMQLIAFSRDIEAKLKEKNGY